MRIETSVIGLGEESAAIETWERSPDAERFAYDYRGLVEPWLRSEEFAADVDNLVDTIEGDGSTDAAQYIWLPALRRPIEQPRRMPDQRRQSRSQHARCRCNRHASHHCLPNR